jgi:hypothetical protein
MNIKEIINQINEYRKQKNYAESDKLRDLLIKSGIKIKLKDNIVILDTEIKLKKCAFCNKSVEKLFNCLILKETPRTYGRPPEYFEQLPEWAKETKQELEHIVWEISHLHSVPLCNECANKPYTLKYTQKTYNPINLQ